MEHFEDIELTSVSALHQHHLWEGGEGKGEGGEGEGGEWVRRVGAKYQVCNEREERAETKEE